MCMCAHGDAQYVCMCVCVDRDSWALNRTRLLDKSMRQWGGHHLPCYSAERTPIHVLRTHLNVCVCERESIYQPVFMDPAVYRKTWFCKTINCFFCIVSWTLLWKMSRKISRDSNLVIFTLVDGAAELWSHLQLLPWSLERKRSRNYLVLKFWSRKVLKSTLKKFSNKALVWLLKV